MDTQTLCTEGGGCVTGVLYNVAPIRPGDDMTDPVPLIIFLAVFLGLLLPIAVALAKSREDDSDLEMGPLIVASDIPSWLGDNG